MVTRRRWCRLSGLWSVLLRRLCQHLSQRHAPTGRGPRVRSQSRGGSWGGGRGGGGRGPRRGAGRPTGWLRWLAGRLRSPPGGPPHLSGWYRHLWKPAGASGRTRTSPGIQGYPRKWLKNTTGWNWIKKRTFQSHCHQKRHCWCGAVLLPIRSRRTR